MLEFYNYVGLHFKSIFSSNTLGNEMRKPMHLFCDSFQSIHMLFLAGKSTSYNDFVIQKTNHFDVM